MGVDQLVAAVSKSIVQLTFSLRCQKCAVQIRLVGGVVGDAHPIGVRIEASRVGGSTIVFSRLRTLTTGQAWPA